jgi:hypothetical protein
MGSLAPQFHDSPTVVPTKSLDDILRQIGTQRVDILKVDVEGFEVAVFQGAIHLLNGNRPPMIVFEFVDWAETRGGFRPGQAQEFLRRSGFAVYRFRDWKERRRALPDIVTVGAEMFFATKN